MTDNAPFSIPSLLALFLSLLRSLFYAALLRTNCGVVNNGRRVKMCLVAVGNTAGSRIRHGAGGGDNVGQVQRRASYSACEQHGRLKFEIHKSIVIINVAISSPRRSLPFSPSFSHSFDSVSLASYASHASLLSLLFLISLSLSPSLPLSLSFTHTHIQYTFPFSTSFPLTIKTARRIFRDAPRTITRRPVGLHVGKKLDAFNLESDAPLCGDRLPHPPPRRRRLLWQDAPRDRSIA